ncbi:MAG: phospho-N-acetylmuramoyl-pentapeptide-transferase [Flavobacteriaceae bacterium TMED200]|nr:phospho-N-acetylmuramoyl-pentapeptide-transferase [Flavobacteriaceae bacterium]OUW66639.1 MAG: phospho-N-acetylmuramoyl-pentapeptide-transferase [Flavobacteriaceae bacterium TMED200]|tara:strand:- start:19585 stop:20802 length:1218 start_codon:yes stop_codon:yes gene_type:complete
MLYYLFNFLEQKYQIPGAGLFQYISFRAAFALIFSLIISIFFGRKIIKILTTNNIGEKVRVLGLSNETKKNGTPTMGGIIIIIGTLIPVLLFSKFNNTYIILLIFTTIWMGVIGFIDDYIKIFKNDKKGLKGSFKVIGQIMLGIVVSSTIYFHPDITIKQKILEYPKISKSQDKTFYKEEKSTKTTIPLVKDNEFDYYFLIEWSSIPKSMTWIIFIPMVIFIITAVSNGANLTDGIDGLAAGSSAIMAITLGIFAWVSGNIIFSDYLNIMYIPSVGEITVFIASFTGALIGFLWFNTYPADVFMGDTGSLTVGALISVIAIMVRKELLLPIICGIFLVEVLSVIIQVFYFKYTKRKKGVGERIFLMSPIHHHFQKKGLHESKIVSRFLIMGVLLSVLAILTLKIR